MKYYTISLYALFWALLSEKLSLESVVVGLIICMIVMFFNKGLFESKKQAKKKKFITIKMWISYLSILIKEIITANFNVAKIVLSPKIKINPTMVSYKTNLKDEFNKTILANSITLTPGTITVSLDKNNLTVHCLDSEYEEGLVNSKFEKILLKVEE